jgi:VWFA-related protein
LKETSTRARLRAALLTLSLLLQAATSGAQQQQPQRPAAPADEDEVVRLNTELVQLRAVVTDRKGQPVENLKKEDFEVFENGRPRAVDFFSAERLPAAADAAGRATTNALPTPSTTRATAERAAPARTIVLFADTLHLTPVSLIRAKTALKRFVDEEMTDRDLVAVVSTYGTLGVLQQFTRDRRVLKYAIDKLSLFHGPHTSITPYLAHQVLLEDQQALDEVIKIMGDEEGYIRMNGEAAHLEAESRSRAVLAESANLSRATMCTLGAVSSRLASMRGQRLVAFVSDGFSLYDEGGGIDRNAFADAVGAAARAGVMIYAVYPKGLVGPEDRTSGPVPGAQEGGKFMLESLTDYQMNLREMAEETGGAAYVNTNDTAGALRKMLDSNRVYYSLAYYLPKDSDRKFRKIEVKVKGHPEYSVRAQRGYAPPQEKTDALAATTPRQKLVEAMMSPLPAVGIGVTSSADFLEREGDEAQVTLRVHLDGDALGYERRGQEYLFDCEMAVAVIDEAGKVAASLAEPLKGFLTPAQYEEAKLKGFRFEKRLSLAPGLYQVRVGVREVGSERLGTSASWVEVPDLAKGKPALSSIFLGKGQEPAAGVGAGAAPPRLIPGRATFRPGEVAFYRFVVYNAQALARQQQGAMVKVEIVQGETRVYEGAWQPLGSRAIRSDRKGTEAGGQLKLSLAPGVYTLRLTVKDAGSKQTVQQTADFEVES